MFSASWPHGLCTPPSTLDIQHSTSSTEHCSSVPTIVANLDFSVRNAHRKRGGRLVRRRTQRFAIAYAKTRAVPRTFDLVPVDLAARKLAAIVRADVFDRVKLAVEIEDDDLRAVDVGNAPLARRELALARDADPVAHTATTSISGSIWRTRLSMPASVPERELGQLPHAP